MSTIDHEWEPLVAFATEVGAALAAPDLSNVSRLARITVAHARLQGKLRDRGRSMPAATHRREAAS